MPNNDYPTAQVQTTSGFSLIWIIPLTAALIGGWLVYKYYSERGTMITITFDKASGIEAKKTAIRYKDIQVGRVQKLRLTSDLKKVVVVAEIFPEMAQNLGENTRFWVERPRLTLQGISGLDTLLSGVHIGIDPGKRSPPKKYYDGLETAPLVTTDKEGSVLVLNSHDLGSLNVGSPVYYHKINVGEVTGYKLNTDTGNVDISIYIHAPYNNKIKSNTRFWNASGVDVDLSASGVSMRMESLVSLLIGGIAFETPKGKVGYAVTDKTKFKLYNSYKLANDNKERLEKLFYVMYFDDSLHGLSSKSVIEFSGVKVGKVESILLQKMQNNTQVKTLVKVSLYIDKFSDTNQRAEAEHTLQNLVGNGLKAQLTVDSLITGAQFISLNMPKKSLHLQKEKHVFALLPTGLDDPSVFPTKDAPSSILNFDASEITAELNKAISSVTALLNSQDIKKTLKGVASTAESIAKITTKLDQKGFSGELVNTLTIAQKTADDLSHLLANADRTLSVLQKDGTTTLRTISNVSSTLQKDISTSLQTFNNVSNKLQKDASVSMHTFNNVSNKLQKDASASMKTFNNVSNKLQKEASVSLHTFNNVSNKLQKDLGISLRTFNNVSNKLQQDTRKTLRHIDNTTVVINKSLKATLSEDSALQYRLQQLINDLGEASRSFSTLADTLQRKPNAVIFGK
ncbi:MAG: MCE family protein [Cocleimonas sp.]|nr:MCE family protein [Cocleimonas sp.]